MAILRNLIFDLDGTLIHSLPGIEHAARLAVAAVAPERQLPSLAPFVGPPIRLVLARALAEDDEQRLDAIEAHFRAAYDAQGWRYSECFPGVAGALARFRARGLHCFVVTNKPHAATAKILEALELRAYFEDVLSPDSCAPRLASKRAAVALLLARHGLPSHETCLIGDSPEDREAAEANGLRFIAAGYGYGGVDGADRLASPADFASLFGG